MAEEIKQPRKKPPKQTGGLFLGCFGCRSRTTFNSKANSEGKKKVVRGLGPGLYWSISKSAATTVPVEAAAAAIVATVKTAVESDKSGVIRRYSQLRLEPAVSAAATDGPPPEATQEKRRDDGQKPRRMESGEKQSVRREANTVRKKRSPPLSPDPVTTSAVVWRKPDSDNRLDPIVGMSIVMVTLMVLVSWGQLCAILCTAAWFYILPRLRPLPNRIIANKAAVESSPGDVYLSSAAYKKKVVLEGLLERNRRNSSPVT